MTFRRRYRRIDKLAASGREGVSKSMFPGFLSWSCRYSVLLSACTVLTTAGWADAEILKCKGELAFVVSEDPLIASSVCATVERTSKFLGKCGLSVATPVHVSVSDELPLVGKGCLGLFECEQQQIWLRTPAGMAEVRHEIGNFNGLDDQVVFESIVAHEWAHAAFEQTACQSALCVDNHEYVANVAQMWSLPESLRDQLVAEFPVKAPVDTHRLNAFVAALAPDRFAAIAWQHFSEEGNGCDFVADLIEGRRTLQLLPE